MKTHPHHSDILISMVLILLFASVVYLWQINAVSFWEDESWMAIAIRGDLPGVWTFAAERGLHPPLYFYLAWFFARLAGNGEVALRWLGGLCALIGIAFTYRLGATLFTRRAGVYAALIASGSLFLIYFARLARHYTLFFALAVALLWVYERWRRDPSWRRGWIAIILLQAALLYTHYFGAWLGVIITLHGLVSLKRRDWLRLVGGLVISGILFLPWVPALIDQYSRDTRGLGYSVFDTGMALQSYLGAIFNAVDGFGWALAALGVIAILRLRKGRAGLLLALWLILPLALTLLLNERYHIFVRRNFLFTLGGAAILLAVGLGWLAEHRFGKVVATAAAIVFALLGPLNYAAFWGGILVTPDWRETARQIAEDARPDDLFVLRGEPYSLDYYLARFMGGPVTITRFDDWMANPVTPDRIWHIDGDEAVRFEAIDALDPDAILTRRPVVLPNVAELYQRPPTDAVTTFGDLFALGIKETAFDAEPRSSVTVDLWWQKIAPVDFDYSAGVYLVSGEGVTVAENNGGFDRGRQRTSTMPLDSWIPDERTLSLPADLPPGDYTLLVSVYDWRDNTRLVPTAGREDDLYELGTVQIE